MSQTGVASTGLRRQASSSRIVTSSRRSSHLWEWRCAGRPYSSPNSTGTTGGPGPVGLYVGRRAGAPKSSATSVRRAAGSLRSAPRAGRCDRPTRDSRSAARPWGTGPSDCRATRRKDRSGRTRGRARKRGLAFGTGRAATGRSRAGFALGSAWLEAAAPREAGDTARSAADGAGCACDGEGAERFCAMSHSCPVGVPSPLAGEARRRGLAGTVPVDYPASRPGKPFIRQGKQWSEAGRRRALAGRRNGRGGGGGALLLESFQMPRAPLPARPTAKERCPWPRSA